MNKCCRRLKIAVSKIRAAWAPSQPTFIRATILTRDVAVGRQAGLPVSRLFQHATRVLLPALEHLRPDPVVRSQLPGNGVDVRAVWHGWPTVVSHKRRSFTLRSLGEFALEET